MMVEWDPFKSFIPKKYALILGNLRQQGTQIDYSDHGKYVNIALFIDRNFIPREIDSFVGDSSSLTEPFKIENIKKDISYLT